MFIKGLLNYTYQERRRPGYRMAVWLALMANKKAHPINQMSF